MNLWEEGENVNIYMGQDSTIGAYIIPKKRRPTRFERFVSDDGAGRQKYRRHARERTSLLGAYSKQLRATPVTKNSGPGADNNTIALLGQ